MKIVVLLLLLGTITALLLSTGSAQEGYTDCMMYSDRWSRCWQVSEECRTDCVERLGLEADDCVEVCLQEQDECLDSCME